MKTVTERPPTRLAGNRSGTEDPDPLAAERRAFERQRRQLLRRFPGEYVALYGGGIVGRDKDCEALATRLFAKLGDVPFFIARVESRPTVYDLPSPEVEAQLFVATGLLRSLLR
ncbi:MAG: hypothetical protein AUI83_24195 [Armatimonadetes bacterium 13_1_40CM_3_65_7]|nr:MAG: hypothetical protein AUI83_24195 [Armatimonadetes bacterium 13_1_40CM_3_65_7]